jgi:hypothetical protein
MTSIPVKAKLPAAVAAMSAVNFWIFSDAPNDNDYVGPIPGHADATGAIVSTDAGQGIPEITWMLVSAKP